MQEQSGNIRTLYFVSTLQYDIGTRAFDEVVHAAPLQQVHTVLYMQVITVRVARVYPSQSFASSLEASETFLLQRHRASV